MQTKEEDLAQRRKDRQEEDRKEKDPRRPALIVLCLITARGLGLRAAFVCASSARGQYDPNEREHESSDLGHAERLPECQSGYQNADHRDGHGADRFLVAFVAHVDDAAVRVDFGNAAVGVHVPCQLRREQPEALAPAQQQVQVVVYVMVQAARCACRQFLFFFVFPFKNRDQQSAALRNWDLWGPMVSASVVLCNP